MIHPERDDWARQLTALRQQMAEQAASLDASGEFPRRNIDHLRAGGWLSLAVPSSCGGAGASLAQLQQARRLSPMTAITTSSVSTRSLPR